MSPLAQLKETGYIRICIYIDSNIETEGNICFKELAHAIVGAGKSEICRAGQKAGDSEKS